MESLTAREKTLLNRIYKRTEQSEVEYHRLVSDRSCNAASQHCKEVYLVC
jgi:hypothetical protein